MVGKILTRDESSKHHGELLIAADPLAVTVGGTVEQRRKARVKPSRIDSGNSVCREGGGT